MKNKQEKLFLSGIFM